MARRRLDAELVRRGLVATRSQARSAVRGGLVLVSGRSASKPSTLVDAAEPLELVGEPRRFASRAGEKLEPRSNGSRSTCMVATPWTRGRRPAASRTACSVEARRTWWRSTSATGSQRKSLGQTNASRSSIGPTCATCPGHAVRAPAIVVADLSSSAPPRDPGARPVLVGDADLVLLVKPQFEVGRERVGSGGVVRDPDAWRDAILGVADASTEHGLLADRC